MAQLNLGSMYRLGEGAPENWIRAYTWWNLAANNGYENAAKARDALAKELTPEQLAEAQSLSTEIFKRTEANRKD